MTCALINDLCATDYYVAFNHQIGINSGTMEARNQVTITQQEAKGNGHAKLGAGYDII